jgi:diguanylate cyclase (GGDEF)-like protein/PAS domain S-box-containing protein
MSTLQYTPYVWPFVGSLAITTWLGLYAYQRRHLHAVSIFAALMLALTAWTFCYTLELLSATLDGKTFWLTAKYFGATTGPVLWFILALRLTRNDHWLSPGLRLLLAAFVVITCLVVFTNDYHHWYWTRLYLVPGEPESQSEHGFFFWIYAGVTYSLVLTSVLLFFQYYRTTPAFYRRQALLMALGGFVPLGGRILEDFFKIDVFPKVDNIILLFLISGILFAYAIFRYSALRLVHIGHSLVIKNMSAGIIVLDVDERVVEINPYARALAGPAKGALTGRPLTEVFPEWPQLALGLGADQEVPFASDGGERWFHVQSSPIMAPNGTLAGYALALFDVTARKRVERQLIDLARTDPLTGVTNRRHFYELAAAELVRAERYQRTVALMMLDIDHFKQINDTYGHRAGDEVIRRVAAACQQQLRAADLFARYGGEEFIALLEPGAEDAALVAERIRQAVAAVHFEVNRLATPVTISVGVASRGQGELSLDELIGRADQALYASKSGGRNRVSIWGAEALPAPEPGELCGRAEPSSQSGVISGSA